ncbi:MerR family transcriptional regulator [Galactobacter caseinivorans]|uniref:MerR family transcriptional regulator n=1 Tax=Galactobacter caseinivorans TaxID=2676123 RepID=A0A496PI71_9MICC|nr:MerR family transcriptional regulator [Galactobacter caseinivorans]RKW70150.1 MerR family transcriptional regulator [Galactobacter caseinivorans]
MEWMVNQLAERAGISGRTLRHYHRIGLLIPDRIGSNGYRYYGPASVARLQRILLLRDAGMALSDVVKVLDSPSTPAAEEKALQAHLQRLAEDRDTLDRRISAVQHTLQMRREGREPRMDVMLQGFNDAYEDEVVQRWGRQAFDASNQWWHAKSVRQQREWKERSEALLARWREVQETGCRAESEAAREHAGTHLRWFAEIPGTPTHAGDREQSLAMVLGLADAYEVNPGFHASFGTEAAARFAAQALRLHAPELL